MVGFVAGLLISEHAMQQETNILRYPGRILIQSFYTRMATDWRARVPQAVRRRRIFAVLIGVAVGIGYSIVEGVPAALLRSELKDQNELITSKL